VDQGRPSPDKSVIKVAKNDVVNDHRRLAHSSLGDAGEMCGIAGALLLTQALFHFR
jgi:hypothetical protein